jgi:hypothetical protein
MRSRLRRHQPEPLMTRWHDHDVSTAQVPNDLGVIRRVWLHPNAAPGEVIQVRFPFCPVADVLVVATNDEVGVDTVLAEDSNGSGSCVGSLERVVRSTEEMQIPAVGQLVDVRDGRHRGDARDHLMNGWRNPASHPRKALGLRIQEGSDPNGQICPFDQLAFGSRMQLGLLRIASPTVELFDAHMHDVDDPRIGIQLISQLLRRGTGEPRMPDDHIDTTGQIIGGNAEHAALVECAGRMDDADVNPPERRVDRRFIAHPCGDLMTQVRERDRQLTVDRGDAALVRAPPRAQREDPQPVTAHPAPLWPSVRPLPYRPYAAHVDALEPEDAVKIVNREEVLAGADPSRHMLSRITIDEDEHGEPVGRLCELTEPVENRISAHEADDGAEGVRTTVTRCLTVVMLLTEFEARLSPPHVDDTPGTQAMRGLIREVVDEFKALSGFGE